jgi:hypothetical protein
MDGGRSVLGEARSVGPVEESLQLRWNRVVGRRSFLKGVGAAGAAALSGGVFTSGAMAGTARSPRVTSPSLRFLAAAEILETDLWQQYNELVAGNPAYMAALQNLDDDMPEYIADNTNDELSHGDFVNAYLKSKGAPQEPGPVPDACEQQGDRRRAEGPSDQPAASERGHQLVPLLSLGVCWHLVAGPLPRWRPAAVVTLGCAAKHHHRMSVDHDHPSSSHATDLLCSTGGATGGADSP